MLDVLATSLRGRSRPRRHGHAGARPLTANSEKDRIHFLCPRSSPAGLRCRDLGYPTTPSRASCVVRAILTVGHGTLAAAAFAELLHGAAVDLVIDVRRFPGSRRHPHFAGDEMSVWLPQLGTDYLWLPARGGRRRPTAGSPNPGLRNPQFRAYADHMASDEFAVGVRDVCAQQSKRAVAVKCSESLWWRCHRRLLADHLVLVERLPVDHLFHDGRHTPHPVMSEARRVNDRVVYDSSIRRRPKTIPQRQNPGRIDETNGAL
jgi:hypothetical protein